MAIELGDGRLRRIRRVLSSVIVLLLAGNAVALAAIETTGTGAASPPAAAPSVPAPEVTLPPTTTPVSTPVSTPKGSTKPPSGSKQVPTTTPSGPPVFAEGDFKYEVTLEPTCVAPGQDIKATLRLKPDTGVVMLPVYADGAHQEQWGADTAKEDGVVVWSWKALAVPGDGILLTQAHDKQTDTKGTVSVRFRVVKAGSPC